MIERGDDSSDDSDEDDNDDEDDDDSSSDEEEVKVAPPPKVCLQFKSPFIKGKKTYFFFTYVLFVFLSIRLKLGKSGPQVQMLRLLFQGRRLRLLFQLLNQVVINLFLIIFIIQICNL